MTGHLLSREGAKPRGDTDSVPSTVSLLVLLSALGPPCACEHRRRWPSPAAPPRAAPGAGWCMRTAGRSRCRVGRAQSFVCQSHLWPDVRSMDLPAPWLLAQGERPWSLYVHHAGTWTSTACETLTTRPPSCSTPEAGPAQQQQGAQAGAQQAQQQVQLSPRLDGQPRLYDV